jgi:predicted  nucleic acid-binding Zn-ribbon protein
MLDVRNTAIAIDARYGVDIPVPPSPKIERKAEPPKLQASEPTDDDPFLEDRPTLSSHRLRISLDKILAISAALRSNISVDIVEPTSQWAKILAVSLSEGPQSPTLGLADEPGHEVAPHISETLTVLMREVLLLRNELNFELWLSRENAKHVGRLYDDKVLTKNAETERQGLYNKLRRYRAQVVTLERELKELRDISASSKSKYEDWTTELHQKLRNLRKEKDAWLKESAALRDAASEAQSMFEAQKTLLAVASKKVFDLETQRREVQHKIDRLRDYERQIEQHVKIQTLWDSDFAKFNQRAQEIDDLRTALEQMRLRQQSYEQTIRDLEEQTRRYRREIQTMEAKPVQAQDPSPTYQDDLVSLLAEKVDISERLRKERERNDDLNDEMEELHAMVEVLRGQVSQAGLGLKPSPEDSHTIVEETEGES